MANNKITGVITMMVVGGLLLVLFIGRWLQTEFNTAKLELNKDIFEQFIDAKTRLTDTLIAKNLIQPILDDTAGFKIETYAKKGVNSDGDSVQIITSTAFGDTAPNLIEVKGLPHGVEQESFNLEFSTDSSDILFQSVKMFITEVNKNETKRGFFTEIITAEDTTQLQSFFSANLANNNISVKPVWVAGRAEKMFPPPMFYYESHILQSPYGVEIQEYNGYLIKALLPEIIFSLLLIGVITLAFIFSYRNIRNQMRLAVLKDDLISNISHELKTPVATVKVAIEALQHMNPQQQQEKMTNYLGMAAQEISRLDLLVNKVMNSILLDNGKQVFQSEPIVLKNIIDEAILGMQMQVQQKGGVIQFLPGNVEGNIVGDSLHIKGVIFNLIENSLKYSNEQPQINIQLAEEKGKIIVTIADNGPGIPEAYTQKIFEKFFRVPSGNKHNIKGYGLGLYYAAQVMQQSGGSISVANNLTKGCTFTLVFPQA